MKLLTANFLTCAVKSCKSSPDSFPLHFRDAELEQVDMAFNPLFLTNLLPRIEWPALRTAAAELGLATLPETKPEIAPLKTPAPAPQAQMSESESEDTAMDTGTEAMTTATATTGSELDPEDERVLRDLHRLLLETQVVEGKMVCGNCGFEYRIKEGIANFLLPSHLV